MIGLFCGFSILSIAELFVCIGLQIFWVFTLCFSKPTKPTSPPKTDIPEDKGMDNEAIELETPPKEKQSNDDVVDEKPRIVKTINVDELV